MAKKVMNTCVIVCASPDADADFIKAQINPDDFVIAADGGMNLLNQAGIIPDMFVGDFDSYDGGVPSGVQIVRLNTHKDDTDSMHCAGIAVELGFENVLLLGASGGSFSHTFANYSVLSFLCDKGINAVMLSEYERVQVLKEGSLGFKNQNGGEFSVFPFGCASVDVTYIGGVEYPASELRLYENDTLGKSNVFRSDNVTISVKNGKAIIFSSLKEI